MRRIPLTQGKFAIVDDKDYPSLSKHKWYARRVGVLFYAGRGEKRNGKRFNVHMHREIMKTPANLDTDHLNGNGLDNRRKNLRVCSHADNMNNRPRLNRNNTSGHAGVVWDKRSKKWVAQMKRNYRMVFLGSFSRKSDAIKVRNKALTL